MVRTGNFIAEDATLNLDLCVFTDRSSPKGMFVGQNGAVAEW